MNSLYKLKLGTAGLLILGVATFSFPALALDADDFATKVTNFVAKNGYVLTYDSIEEINNDIVLKSSKLGLLEETPLEVGNITFKGIYDNNDGNYYVAEVLFDDVDFTNDGVNVSMNNMSMTGFTVSGNLEIASLDDIIPYEGYSIGEISITYDETKVFSMTNLDVDIIRSFNGSEVKFLMDDAKLDLDLSKIYDAKTRKALDEMGYTKLSGSLGMFGLWDVNSGKISLNEYALKIDDIGRLTFSLEMSGYTLDFIKDLQNVYADAASKGIVTKEVEAQLMNQLGVIKFNSAKLSFEDDSFTDKFLAYAGKSQGLTTEEMRNTAKVMAPMVFASMGLPKLQQQVTNAVSTYLTNPNSISISSMPKAPLSALDFVQDEMNKGKVVDMLNIKVEAK